MSNDILSNEKIVEELEKYLKPPASAVFKRALANSENIKRTSAVFIADYIKANKLDATAVSFACVGSVGRGEALETSDLDLSPIFVNQAALDLFDPHIKAIRAGLQEELRIPVSKGEDLTKSVTLDELLDRECIGGTRDDSSALTKRVLVLTEGTQIGGSLELKDIKRRILLAYGDEDRTSGRHVLSFCNDLARYYRTLCIEYKAKVDAHGKEWSTRNIKLRHSRKLWYFSNMISMVSLAEKHPRGEGDFHLALLNLFEMPSYFRLVHALAKSQPIEIGRLLEHYSLFLEFMSNPKNRAALAQVQHNKRYELTGDNPFPAMKLNSDVIHNYLLSIIFGMSPAGRQRIFDWFLL